MAAEFQGGSDSDSREVSREASRELPSYETNDPRGWRGDPKRGAALGRVGVHEAARDEPIKLVLRRVRLDAGGYDRLGTYFGEHRKLYWYASSCGRVDAMLRADSREQAKAKIRERYTRARFYR